MPEEFRRIDMSGLHCLNEVASAEEFIADKKILIVPIFSGGGIRVKILEAMAAGKIVITTSTGIKGIEAKPDEHYLRVHHPEDFAKAIKWCIEHKPQAEELARKAQELVIEKYEHSKVMGKVTEKVGMMIEIRRL
jgi:glycosyltransferase involved in cell wall biosynthesis